MADIFKCINNLRKLRIGSGVSQSIIAERLGFASTDRISHWECGTAFPSIVNLFKLAVLYNVAPHDLYEDLYHSTWLEMKHGRRDH